jgi:hypothetical protein
MGDTINIAIFCIYVYDLSRYINQFKTSKGHYTVRKNAKRKDIPIGLVQQTTWYYTNKKHQHGMTKYYKSFSK